MKIIYISALISKTKANYIVNNAKLKPLQSIQRFHRLLCEGLVKNGAEVKTISAIPMSRKIMKRVCWIEKNEIENGVEYTYLPFLNIKIIRQICMFFGMIVKIIAEAISSKGEKIIVCDILNTTISVLSLGIAKMFKIPCIAIITDLPRDIGGKYSISKKTNEFFQDKYDGYIIITEAMNEVVNKRKKPYVVLEGVADEQTASIKQNKESSKEKICIYAGGLYEKYGVKTLIEAFMKLENSDIKLHLYGSGDLEEYIKQLNNDRVIYYGVVTNDEILEAEKQAVLLINPRFTNEEYTKYSFPSKNIEYMSTGTATLTTILPGMPKEYHEHVYLFDEETVEGYYNTLKNILDKSKEELMIKGEQAQKFIKENKNNKKQAQLILNLIKKIKEERS